MTLEEQHRTCSYCSITFPTKDAFSRHFDNCPCRIELGYIEPTVSYYKTRGTFLLKEEFYRSSPLVNMTEDRVRITLDMPRVVWYALKSSLRLLSKAKFDRVIAERDSQKTG